MAFVASATVPITKTAPTIVATVPTKPNAVPIAVAAAIAGPACADFVASNNPANASSKALPNIIDFSCKLESHTVTFHVYVFALSYHQLDQQP